VIGAVYEIPTNEKPALDDAEGLGSGYHEEIVRVLSAKGEEVVVCTYIADASFIDDSLQPYSWYKDFVLAVPKASATGICRKPDGVRPLCRTSASNRAEIKLKLPYRRFIGCLWAKMLILVRCRVRLKRRPGEGARLDGGLTGDGTFQHPRAC
jgi:hypothetical protein